MKRWEEFLEVAYHLAMIFGFLFLCLTVMEIVFGCSSKKAVTKEKVVMVDTTNLANYTWVEKIKVKDSVRSSAAASEKTIMIFSDGTIEIDSAGTLKVAGLKEAHRYRAEKTTDNTVRTGDTVNVKKAETEQRGQSTQTETKEKTKTIGIKQWGLWAAMVFAILIIPCVLILKKIRNNGK
ncbi:MAG: hypothetical protein LUC88_04675 [Prevotella sp.]|nr:hypothetical protein [Prevotella sp.]